jgi:hypothetical protein
LNIDCLCSSCQVCQMTKKQKERKKYGLLPPKISESDTVYLGHGLCATFSISNPLHDKCMNLLHLPEKLHISILDGGADTCILRQRWEVLSVHNTRRANVVGFDNFVCTKKESSISQCNHCS